METITHLFAIATVLIAAFIMVAIFVGMVLFQTDPDEYDTTPYPDDNDEDNVIFRS